MGKTKYIISGLMGVGKTFMLDRLYELPGCAQHMDIQDEEFFIEIARKKDADFTTLILDKFLDPNSTITDSCLWTHFITDVYIFGTQRKTEVMDKLKAALGASDINKDDYYIYVLEKPWILTYRNIVSRGRPYELDMLDYAHINRNIHERFYTDVIEFYKDLGFKNVYIEYYASNQESPELDFVDFVNKNGGINNECFGVSNSSNVK